MKAEKNNGFTLIELIAVLVILAILALIVTPIVLNIVKNAKDAANKRSVDAYGKTVELSVATYMLDNGEYPTCQSDLKIEYSGNEVNCNIMNLNENGSVYLSECTVGGKEVKDSSTEDGWYHYGKVSEISAEPINNSYKIGDVVTYNEMDFYVIANSDDTQDSVTLLKAEPLTVDEVKTYGKDHINKYTFSSVGTVYDSNGYGSMAYYSSSTCGFLTAGLDSSERATGCNTNYKSSDIKYVVDAWGNDTLKLSDLKTDDLGYKVRLITYDELYNNLGYSKATWWYSWYVADPEYTPNWVYSDKYEYWTMSTSNDSTDSVWIIYKNGGWEDIYVFGRRRTTVENFFGAVRPVINLYKSAINNPNSQKVSNVIDLKCS